MSEHIFGLHKGHLRSKADEIAKRHGAWHINFTEPRGEKRGWFACPNRGTAFDQATANDVLAAIDAAGGLNAMRRADRAAVSLGRRGGKAGTGASQRRTPEQYAATQAKARHSRRVKAARKMLNEAPIEGLTAEQMATLNAWGQDVVRDALALEG